MFAIVWRNGNRHNARIRKAGAHSANDINELGQIVGWHVVGTRVHAVRWTRKLIEDLGDGQANAINNLGQVVGRSSSGEARLWDHGQATHLGSFPNASCSGGEATDIND